MNKNKYIVLGLFLLGLGLRLYSAIIQPLWLDEIYSLYFANSFSPFNLLTKIPETHPGMYYLFLKICLYFSTNMLLLRTLTSILPSVLGIYFLYRRYPHLPLLFFLLLNPFFIHQSWQLRPYGITFMFSCLIISLFVNYPKNFNLKKFLIFSFMSTFFSFSLIIPIFCLSIFLYVRQKKWPVFLPFFIVVIQFFLFKGFSTYKQYAELASWISPPSVQNFPNLILTLLGFSTDLNNLGHTGLCLSLIFIIIFTLLTIYFSRRYQLFLYSFTLPLLIVILISITFPILSQRFFFYHFIPKLSLFIPRFMLPLSLYFYVCLSTKNRPYLLALFFLLWLKPFYKINLQPFYSQIQIINHPSSTLILPPWENLRLQAPFTHQDLDRISTDFKEASEIESKLLTQTTPDCSSLDQYQQVKYIIDPKIKSLDSYHYQIQNIINQCSPSLLQPK